MNYSEMTIYGSALKTILLFLRICYVLILFCVVLPENLYEIGFIFGRTPLMKPIAFFYVLKTVFFYFFEEGAPPPKSSYMISSGSTPSESNMDTTALDIGPGPHI